LQEETDYESFEELEDLEIQVLQEFRGVSQEDLDRTGLSLEFIEYLKARRESAVEIAKQRISHGLAGRGPQERWFYRFATASGRPASLQQSEVPKASEAVESSARAPSVSEVGPSDLFPASPSEQVGVDIGTPASLPDLIDAADEVAVSPPYAGSAAEDTLPVDAGASSAIHRNPADRQRDRTYSPVYLLSFKSQAESRERTRWARGRLVFRGDASSSARAASEKRAACAEARRKAYKEAVSAARESSSSAPRDEEARRADRRLRRHKAAESVRKQWVLKGYTVADPRLLKLLEVKAEDTQQYLDRPASPPDASQRELLISSLSQADLLDEEAFPPGVEFASQRDIEGIFDEIEKESDHDTEVADSAEEAGAPKRPAETVECSPVGVDSEGSVIWSQVPSGGGCYTRKQDDSSESPPLALFRRDPRFPAASRIFISAHPSRDTEHSPESPAPPAPEPDASGDVALPPPAVPLEDPEEIVPKYLPGLIWQRVLRPALQQVKIEGEASAAAPVESSSSAPSGSRRTGEPAEEYAEHLRTLPRPDQPQLGETQEQRYIESLEQEEARHLLEVSRRAAASVSIAAFRRGKPDKRSLRDLVFEHLQDTQTAAVFADFEELESLEETAENNGTLITQETIVGGPFSWERYQNLCQIREEAVRVVTDIQTQAGLASILERERQKDPEKFLAAQRQKFRKFEAKASGPAPGESSSSAPSGNRSLARAAQESSRPAKAPRRDHPSEPPWQAAGVKRDSPYTSDGRRVLVIPETDIFESVLQVEQKQLTCVAGVQTLVHPRLVPPWTPSKLGGCWLQSVGIDIQRCYDKAKGDPVAKDFSDIPVENKQAVQKLVVEGHLPFFLGYSGPPHTPYFEERKQRSEEIRKDCCAFCNSNPSKDNLGFVAAGRAVGPQLGRIGIVDIAHPRQRECSYLLTPDLVQDTLCHTQISEGKAFECHNFDTFVVFEDRADICEEYARCGILPYQVLDRDDPRNHIFALRSDSVLALEDRGVHEPSYSFAEAVGKFLADKLSGELESKARAVWHDRLYH